MKNTKKQPTPQKRERATIWRNAIGLQAADGLIVSDYLYSIACKNIEGEITFAEAQNMIETHYNNKLENKPDKSFDDTKEQII